MDNYDDKNQNEIPKESPTHETNSQEDSTENFNQSSVTPGNSDTDDTMPIVPANNQDGDMTEEGVPIAGFTSSSPDPISSNVNADDTAPIYHSNNLDADNTQEGTPLYDPSTPKPFPEPDYPLSDSGNGTPTSKKEKKAKKPRKPLSTVAKAAAIAAVVSLILGGSAGAVVAKMTSSNSASQTSNALSKNSSVIASPSDIQGILSKVEPAVVDIQTKGTVNQGGFFGGSSSFQAAGTGMIISSNGEVLTNNHVIADASSIKVQLFNQTKLYTATVIGTDPTHDVALIKIQGVSKLPTVTFGKSSSLQVGDSVVAVGNALALQGLPTVTQGIVSALHRSITTSSNGITSSTTLSDMIQTDAPINPGNSGGPLVNSSGQVIGMNTAIISGTGSETAQNIGFAEAIDSVTPIIKQIEAHPNSSTGTITSGKAFLGVGVETLSSQIAAQLGLPTNLKGVLVASVVPGSPANKAGITAGSVITKVNKTRVTTATQLVKVIQSKSPGKDVTIYWTNSNGSGSAVVTLGSAPTA